MDKSLELYHEEQRQKLIDLHKSVDTLKAELTNTLQQLLTDTLAVQVTNQIDSVQVNTEKEVAINNLAEVVDSIDKLNEHLANTIIKTYVAPPSEISVTNIADAKVDSVTMKNIADITKRLDALTAAVRDNQPIVNVEKQDVVFPTNPKNPIAVRLSDGKSFYNALFSAISGAMPEVDPLVGYQPCDRDETTATKYYSFAKTNGAWYIMRDDAGEVRYAKGDKAEQNYQQSWTDRATLDYHYIFEVTF